MGPPAVHSPPPPVVEAVEEITAIYRSLPPRPTFDEVEAAKAVLKTVDTEEKLRRQEIANLKKPPDLPAELFSVLKDFKKNLILMQSLEQRKEALYLVDVDKKFRAFDELIHKASILVSAGAPGGKQEDLDDPIAKIERRSGSAEESLFGKEEVERENSGVLKGYNHGSFRKDPISSSCKSDKLSLIKVASLIETSAKSKSRILNLQGKLMDQVQWLPVSLGKLSDVTELDLSENRIMALPSTLSSLKCLMKLDIHSNQLVNLPESFGELCNLVDLDLHGNQLKSLPKSIGNLSRLVTLNLSSNHLSFLPETIGNLTGLKVLNVETNELEELPYTIGSCSSLVELRVDFNQLKALPEAVGKLELLETLTLHYNRVKTLPTTMASLSRLKELDVSFNELESVPENLCFATHLVQLNLGSNFADLRSLPRSIGNLEMLEVLDISNNQIRVLPDSFRFLSKLRVLNADETPLEVPPRKIVKLGAQAVVEYMGNLAMKKDVAPQQPKKKGFWFWLISLFKPSRKNPINAVVEA